MSRRPVDQNAYDSSTFEPARIRRYAQRVARETQRFPQKITESLLGWDCGTMWEYKEVVHNRRNGRIERVSIDGESIYLRRDGTLLKARWEAFWFDGPRSHQAIVEASDQDLLSLDSRMADHRRNTDYGNGMYEEATNSFRRGLAYDTKGVGLSVALKRLLR